jgi:hypothetical protein
MYRAERKGDAERRCNDGADAGGYVRDQENARSEVRSAEGRDPRRATAKERRRLRRKLRDEASRLIAQGSSQAASGEAVGVTDRMIRNWAKLKGSRPATDDRGNGQGHADALWRPTDPSRDARFASLIAWGLAAQNPGVVLPAFCDKRERAARSPSRPQSKARADPVYPVVGCVPQSGDPEPGACVTCVKPVPSTLTV